MKIILTLIFVFIAAQNVLSNDSLKAIYQKAIDAYEKDNYEEAIDMFSIYLSVASAHDEAFQFRGNAYYKLKRYEEANNDYIRAYELGHIDAEMFYRMGMYYKSTSNNEFALRFFKLTVDNDSENKDGFIELGRLSMLKEDFVNAKMYFQRALALDPKVPGIIYTLGNEEFEKRNFDAALENYLTAIEFDSLDQKFYYGAGMTYFEMGDSSQSLYFLYRSISIYPDFAMGYYGLGAVYDKYNNRVRSIENYTRALVFSNSELADSYIYKKRGIEYSEKGVVDSAYNDFETALRLNPIDTIAYLERGKIYYNQMKDTAALNDFNRVILTDDKIAQAHSYRGITYYRLQQDSLAEIDVRRAILMNPSDTMALFTLGNILMENDDYQSAVSNFDKALKVNPNFGVVYENRGISYYNLGFYRQAAADFEAAMKYNPELKTKLIPLYQDARSRFK